MSAVIPTVEPTELVIGDTWTWKRVLSDYPPSVWTLTYRLVPQSGSVIAFSATDSSGDHLVSVSAATTSAYTSGDYRLIGSVTGNSERYEIYRGNVTVHPDVTAAYDYRTYWETIVDTCKEALTGAAGRSEVSYSINGRSRTAKTHDEILSLLAYAQNQVFLESSKGRNRKILGRFI